MTQPQPRITPAPLGQPLRLGILYNSHSGRHRKRWGSHPLPVDAVAVEANNPKEIGGALAQLAAQNVNLLAVAGGDGTIQSVLTHVMVGQVFEKVPLLALIPTGSTNMTGGDAGVVDIRERGWQVLTEWAQSPSAFNQRVTYQPVLKIKPNDHDPAFCGMFLGAGAVYHAVQHTQRNLHSMGLRGDVGPGVALMRFAKAIASRDRRYFGPVNIRLRDAAGNHVEGENILLLASTLNKLLLNLSPFWGEEEAPVQWTTVAEGARGFLRRMPAVCRGQGRGLHPKHGYHSHNSERVEVHFDGGYIVDGEFFEARSADGPVVISSAGEAAFLNL